MSACLILFIYNSRNDTYRDIYLKIWYVSRFFFDNLKTLEIT